jgi:hypothetical protein
VQRLYQGQIADTEIAPHDCLRLASTGKRRPRLGGAAGADGIRESTISCRFPEFLDNYYIGVARTVAHRKGVFAPRRTRSRAAIFPHPGTLPADGLIGPDALGKERRRLRRVPPACVLTRNRIGPAIILQPLHFSVIVRHGFYWDCLC